MELRRRRPWNAPRPDTPASRLTNLARLPGSLGLLRRTLMGLLLRTVGGAEGSERGGGSEGREGRKRPEYGQRKRLLAPTGKTQTSNTLSLSAIREFRVWPEVRDEEEDGCIWVGGRVYWCVGGLFVTCRVCACA